MWRFRSDKSGDLGLDRVERAGLVFYRNAEWGDLAHGIFTRQGGVSKSQWTSLNVGGSNGDDAAAVTENHQRMYRAADVDGGNAVTTWLVHSVYTVVVEQPPNGNQRLHKADAMITRLPGVPLVMRFADCVPILLYDPATPAIGLGHAGWRGTVCGMAGKMVEAMRSSFGSNPDDIEAVIGPAISQRNYQVGEEVVSAAQSQYGDDSDLILADPTDGSSYLDLWLANQMDLQSKGVGKIKILGICTFDNVADFYSHRAENGQTGRFGVVISL